MTGWDIALLIISGLLITIIILQESDDDITSAFTGEKSELFSNKKERGIEVWIKRTTSALSVTFLIIAVICAFFVERI
ncbi:MAG: preprotein translocase subunit SecG [Bacilli bacterium]